MKDAIDNLFEQADGSHIVKTAYLDDARREDVLHAVRDVLHRREALITTHATSRVVFEGYCPGGTWTWSRKGYVGVFQHVGEPEVEVRLVLRAKWPHRILWLVALFNVIAALATVIVNPDGTTWFAVAAVCGLALIVASLLYVNTLKPVRREERELMADFEAEFQNLESADLETEEERELRLFEEELAGEVERSRIKAARKADRGSGTRAPFKFPRPNFDLRRPKTDEARTLEPQGPPAAEETPAEKRERLLKRKAELEALKQREP